MKSSADIGALKKELREHIFTAYQKDYDAFLARPDDPIEESRKHQDKLRISKKGQSEIEFKFHSSSAKKDVCICIHAPRKWRKELGVEENPHEDQEVRFQGVPPWLTAVVPNNGKPDGDKVTLVEFDTGVSAASLFGEDSDVNKGKLVEAVGCFLKVLKDRGILELMRKVVSSNSVVRQAWLLSWNPEKWNEWDYPTICKTTSGVHPYRDSWRCASHNPKVGDEVYLYKAGSGEKGIMAHGEVVEPYKKPTTSGNNGHIGVSFDCILDADKLIIPLKELQERFPLQKWASQMSGITLNAEYVPELKRMWDTILQSRQDGEMRKNLIYFGAPGTGKSYNLNVKACIHKEDGQDVDGEFERANEVPRYERVTFYPTYSYAQFVGTYKPVMKPKKDASGEEDIAYEFVPGPFLRVLVKALKEPTKDWCLIIEEINRANAAAVFGDVFQLLDRNSDGESEYSVAASEDVKKYLQKELAKCPVAMSFLRVSTDKDGDGGNTADWQSCSLRIPVNMYLWATMNSADQGVFPMDTAFKRRWEFEYVGVDASEEKCENWQVEWKDGKRYDWNVIRKFINRLMSLNGVNEDKLMGPFFVKAEEKAEKKIVSAQQFKSKVLMYLWEDAARMCRPKLFKRIDTYSKLCKEWDKNGHEIFSVDGRSDDDVADLFGKLKTDTDQTGSTDNSNSESSVAEGA